MLQYCQHQHYPRCTIWSSLSRIYSRVWVCVYIHAWERERGVKVTCTLFLFVNRTHYVWWL